MNEVCVEGNNITDESVGTIKVLFKYGKLNEFTEKIFTHNEIYFSSPDEFNDPFDSKVHFICDNTKQGRKYFFHKYFPKIYPRQSKKEILARVKRIITERKDEVMVRETLRLSREGLRKKLGICCFTEKRDNILMWAHYAKEHTGFCLEFDVNNDFFTRTLKVQYDAIWPELDVMKLDSPGEVGKKLFIKAVDWQYEKEWRIIDHTKGPGIQNFPEEALIGVILGCRMSEEDKENVFKWCRKRNHPPTFYEAKEKQKEFGLDIVKIDNVMG